MVFFSARLCSLHQYFLSEFVMFLRPSALRGFTLSVFFFFPESPTLELTEGCCVW
eukprot:m.27893 g.27893  ORF g.27893 m.27893 type:complete len:55 (+) comp39932_c0_seq1:105-269(+)